MSVRRLARWGLAVAAAAVLLAAPVAAADDAALLLRRAEIQILLDRAGFSPGEIDGRLGGNTRRAIAAFQRAAKLAPSGEVDEATARRLRAAAPGKLFARYAIRPGDVDGPFVDKIPGDLMLQAELPVLAYTSAREKIAERFHVSPSILARLNPDAGFAAGETLVVPAVGGRPSARAAKVVVSHQSSSLWAYDASGKLLLFAPVTAGSEHDPLPVGDWKVRGVSRHPTFHYNPDLFWDAEASDEKAKIPPGPNNPVGVVWIDVSVEHYGLHGTPEPGRVGHAESHGCVRLTNWDAWALAAMVEPGTPVLFRR